MKNYVHLFDLFYFAGDFRKGYDPNKNRQNWLWDKLSLFTMIAYSAAVPIFSAHFFLFPADPVYPICQVVTLPYIGPVAYITFSIVVVYTICKVLCTLQFMSENVILYYFVFWELLYHELRMAQPKYKVSNNLRKFPNIVYIHRSLHLFLGMLNSSQGLIFPVTHSIVIKMSVFIQVSLIRKWAQLDNLTICLLLFSWLSGQSIWLGALHFAGRMVRESKNTVITWKAENVWGSRADTKFMGKFRKSCPPMTINYHNVYKLKRSSILKFLKTVCRGALRALLAIKGKGQ